MTLSTAEQKAGMEKYVQEEHVSAKKTADLTTTEIIAEFVNIDAFVTSNLTSINNAYSVSFRSKTTQAQRLAHFQIAIGLLKLQSG